MAPVNLNSILRNTFLVVGIFTLVVGANVALKWSLSLYPSKTIYVSAEGKATVSPDIGKISFSVVSEGKNPQVLQENNAKKMTSAIDFVKNLGVNSKDIKTTNYNLSPRYEYDETTRKSYISGYTLTQTALVKVRDLDRVAEVLGGLSELGVNQISSVSFEIDEPDKYLAEARSEAFAKAHEKAKEMAMLNGVKIKRVVNFSEYRGGPIYPYYGETAGRGGDMVSSSYLPPIEPGTEEITIQVNITYEIQ
jgi:uncharacterized protein